MPESLEKNREILPANPCTSTKSPPICINLPRSSLCAGGGVRGLVVLAEAGGGGFLWARGGEKIYNMVTFD